jgi:hypothetical protein
MNLSGPHQRLEMRHQEQGDGADFAVVFRSRPLFLNTALSRRGPVRYVGWQARGRVSPEPLAWHASVWDEVRASADGALLRRIKILITDGPQLDSEEFA